MDDTSYRRLAADLAEAAETGAHEQVADLVALLSRSASKRLPAVVVSELTGLCARAVSARCQTTTDDAYGVQIEDDQAAPVDVDALPPGLRAALRALLAALNDDRPGQDIQAALATRGDPDEVALVLVQCLVWLTELADAPAAGPPHLTCLAT